MTENDPIDVEVIDKLEEMVGLDVVREVIELFLEHAPQRLAGARDSANAGDLDAVQRELHSLKSSAGSIGALGLQRLAEETERLAVEGRDEPVRKHLEELDCLFRRVHSRLADLCREKLA